MPPTITDAPICLDERRKASGVEVVDPMLADMSTAAQ